MTVRRSVVLNGDLGSGKTTVSILLARRLGIRRISVGDLYRTMAAERGMTALQLNLHAELDDKIDHYVDQLQSDIAASGERLIVDSRLAWHFFTDAIKVHLVVDATAAARRVLGRPADEVESYASIEQARTHLASRGDSERTRFISRYGVDKTRLRNYDIVCDSTSAGPEEIVERIAVHLTVPRLYAPEPLCYLDPRRIRPMANAARDGSVQVGYVAPEFFAVGGRDRIEAAIRAGEPLIEAALVAEADEEIDGRGCRDHLRSHLLT
jgi:predicted cytidylate kinase